MKSIILSIRPEWVAKILNGEKTIEIRKTAPKCNLPIDVCIYCTNLHNSYLIDKRVVSNGMYEATTLRHLHNPNKTANITPKSKCVLNGKVVAKFTLRKIEELEDSVDISLAGDGDLEFQTESLAPWELRKESCLTEWKLEDYVGEGKAYAWHISDLVIFDGPMELDSFLHFKKYPKGKLWRKLERAPQSWCYAWKNINVEIKAKSRWKHEI